MDSVVTLKASKMTSTLRNWPKKTGKTRRKRLLANCISTSIQGLLLMCIAACLVACALLYMKVNELELKLSTQDDMLRDFLGWTKVKESPDQQGQTTDDQRDKRALSVKPWFRMTGLPNTRPGDALKDTPAGTVFQWTPENPEDLSRFGRKPRISAAVHTVVILCPGVYDVYADIRLNGRLNLDNVMKPYVGIDLIRKRQTRDPWDVLTSGYITQANMGINDEYFGDDGRPMDTLSVRGKFAFQCGDEVRIRLTPGILSYSPYTDVFMLDGNQAQFEMAIYERHNTYCPQCN